tara:strand:- start:7723 stop:8313 length:591 start_codon:yes stop_codon:yes gene_type:complete
MSILTSKIKTFKGYISSPVPISHGEPRIQYEDGLRGDLLSYASAPNAFQREYQTKLDTNNYLPPPPRNQLASDPVNFMARKNPYKQNVGIYGIIQEQINNANYVRGNQFSATEAVKRLDYTVEFPVRQTATKEIITTSSPFYPYPNYDLIYNKKYKTYAHPKRYIDGLPIIETFSSTNISTGIIIVLIVCFIGFNK